MADKEQKEKTLKIVGRIIDSKTKNGVAGLRVEAWDKDLRVKEVIGSAVTDAKGSFQIEFEEAPFRKLFLNRKPLLSFKVFRGDQLTASTEAPVLWDGDKPDSEVTIKVNIEPLKPLDKTFTVSGEVRRADGSVFQDGFVQALITIQGKERLLGETKPDAKGRFEIPYTLDASLVSQLANGRIIARVLDSQRIQLAESLFIPFIPVAIKIIIPNPPPPPVKTISVQGQVRGQDRSPIVKAIVRAFITTPEKEILLGEATTDAAGFYAITSDQPFRQAANAGLQARVFDKQGKILAASSSPIKEGITTIDLVVPLQPPDEPSNVHGQVRQANGKPLDVGTVRIFGAAPGPEQLLGETTITKNDEGRYRIKYQPGAFSPKLGDATRVVIRVFNNQNQLLVSSPHVRAEADATVDLTMSGNVTETPFVVRGQVTRSGGGGFANGVVRIFGISGIQNKKLAQDAITDDQGRYEISYEAGEFNPAVNPGARAIVRMFDREEKVLVSSEPFNAQQLKVVDLVVTPPAEEKTLKVRGRVVKSDGAVLVGSAGLRVEAWDKELIFKDMVGSAVTDAQGSFQIELEDAFFRKLFLKRRPQLFFKVFQDGRLIHSTESSVVWSEDSLAEIVIELKPEPPQANQRRAVKGNILLADGSPAGALAVIAFNRNLREERALGKSQTDPLGFYEIQFTKDQPKKAEADGFALEVRAFAGNGALLAASPPLFNAPPVAVVDLTIPREVQAPPSLFEKIGSTLAPLLKDVKVPDLNEDEKRQDLSFLSAQTGFEKALLARFVLAQRLSQDRLPPEFWFALLGGSVFQFVENKNLTEQLKTFTDSLSALDAVVVRKSLARAFDQNELAKTLNEKTADWVDAFLKFAVRLAVSDATAPTLLKSALEHAGIKDAEKKEKLARLFSEHQALTPELLTALENDKSFKKEEVADLHASFQLADLTQADFSVVKAIKEKFGVRRPEDIRTLAKKSQSEWSELVKTKLAAGEIKSPVELREAAGVGKPSEAEVFANTLERQFREAFPTTAFAAGLGRSLRNGGVRGLKHAEALGNFLERNENFELLNTSVDDFLKNTPHPDFAKLAKDESFKQEVKAVQRVFKLAPTFEATDALLADGLHSAQQIYRLGESQFVQRYGSVVAGGEKAAGPGAKNANAAGLDGNSASAVWSRAAGTHAAALTIVADLKALDPNALPKALQTGSQALASFPNWESLFQTGDLCDCEACRSVIGPAAYFADLLMYLKDRKAANNASTVKDILFSRRPDLGYLELNCENALTTLPYIDVVNEVLEAAIATDENDVELIGLNGIPDASATTKTAVANALRAAGLAFGADFSLSQVNPLDPNRWVVHGDTRTYLLKKKTTANFFAEVLRNTKASAAELRAYPQYVNPKAYKKLRQAKYPLDLPFDLFGEEVRAAMQKANLQRWDLMETFRGPRVPNNPTDGEIAAEYFGISVDSAALRFNGTMTAAQRTVLLSHPALAGVSGIPSYQQAVDRLFQRPGRVAVTGLPTGFSFPAIITGAPNNIPISYERFTFDEKELILIADATSAGQQTVWGETGNANWLDATGTVSKSICIVKNFLQKTRLEYNELLALLDLKFINPADDIVVHHLDGTCDTARKVIAPLDVTKLDRIHRFLRLWRKLKGWRMWEVDLVIRHPRIGNNLLDEAFLIHLFYFARLRDRLGKRATVEQVCALFGNLNTETLFTKLHEPREDALYQQLFLNSRLINPLDTAFALDPITGDLPAGQTIPAHRPVIVAALGVRESDLVILEEAKKVTDGSAYITHDLTLANLSFLWRHSWLSKVLKFKADEWQLVLKLWPMDVVTFVDPRTAWQFLAQADQIRAAGFTLDELNWLLAADRSARAAVKETDSARFLSGLRKDLQKIHAENDPSQFAFLNTATPTDEGQLTALLTTLLQKLNRDEAEVSLFLAALRGSVQLEVKVQDLPAVFAFPKGITIANHIPIQYDHPNLMLRFGGVMTAAQRTMLRDDPSPALAALQASAQLEVSVQGLPPGFAFPSALNIPIQYDEPNLLLRFTGLMIDAQRTVLQTDSSLALITGIPGYVNAIGDLYQQSLKVVNSYQAGIDDLYQQSLAATTSYLFTESETVLQGGLTLPANRPSLPITHNSTTKAPGFIGVMTAGEQSDLIAANPTAIAIIDELFERPRLTIKFFEPLFSVSLAALPPALDFKAQLPPELSAKISYDAEQRLLRFVGVMSASDRAALHDLVAPAEVAYHTAINSLFSQPHAVLPPTDQGLWLTDNDLDSTQSANDTLAKRLANAGTKALNYLSRTWAAAAVIQQSSAQLKLTEAMTRLLLTRYAVVSIPSIPNKTLLEYLTQDFTATTTVVDYSPFKNAFDAWFWSARVAALWKKWKITMVDWEQLIIITSGARLLDIMTLPLDTGSLPSLPNFLTDRFLRTSRLLRLRDTLPQTEISLLRVLETLSGAMPANLNGLAMSGFPADVEKLNDAWHKADVKALVESLDVTNPSHYLLAETWERLTRAFYFLENLNAGADTVQTFAAPAMSDVEARTLKELLRSKFGSETWLTLSTEIQDVLREHKRDALAPFLLTQSPANPPSQKWENTNDLYAYYLLDVEMSSCQLTSRLVQASGSVQLFVQRCFMGLEPEVKVKADGANGDSAWRWWKWMRKYQVWVANRKVFLWPENWIEPELKPDRSQFFKDLENELLQNEINQPNVETAFANYLEKLDGVAQLEIAGFFQEDDGDNAIVHVFGRTKGAEPHIYYYRRYDYHQWTPWEKVDLDIQGDYLIPAVVNRELFLFWPVFTEVPNEQGNNKVDTPSANQKNVDLQKTKKNLRLQLAVSECRQGKWTPKRVSTGFAMSDTYDVEIVRKHYRFCPIDRSEIDGRFVIKFEGFSLDGNGMFRAGLFGAFEIAGCKGVPELANPPGFFRPALQPEEPSTGVTTSFQRWVELGPTPARRDKENDFSLESYGSARAGLTQVLIETPWLFKMTPPWHLSYFDKLWLDGLAGDTPTPNAFFETRNYVPLGSGLPFFYDDKKRTFFVLPSRERFRYTAHDKGGRDYYPQIKRMVRDQEDDYERQLDKLIERFEPGAVPRELRALMEKFLQSQFQEEKSPPYTDTQLKGLWKRFLMRSVHRYLATQAMTLLQSQQFHFKNFYHPFVCDFAKLVYNPLKGIPALMSRETQLKDSGFSFLQTYVPTPWVVHLATETYYPKELVDFSADGAYSSYNWELFFHAPLLIANALSKNQRFEEAREWYHFIFNPIGVESSMPGAPAMSKFWITKPFFETTDPQYVQQRIDNLLGMLAGNANAGLESQVVDWRTHPFEPHRIANYRTVAYQKTAVMKYLDNLISWGDYLFRQDSMESINEATQLYVLAAELLGPPPKNIPPQAKPPLESFNELENQFDKFSNAMVEIENLVPPLTGNANPGNPAPLPTLYFCIPHNEKMLGYWNTVADRLYKIRHCMNIEGVVRQLALFEPPIDPGALVKAVAGGVDISSALADMNVALPLYHFNVWLQKANEVCNDVKALGGALLSALEKKDAEALGLLRQDQEIRLLEAVKAVREQQIDEVKENLESAKKSKGLAQAKKKYYESREFMNVGETIGVALNTTSTILDIPVSVGYLTAGVLKLIPNFIMGASGFGGTPHVTADTGGDAFGPSAKFVAEGLAHIARNLEKMASLSNTMAGYVRRQEEWDFQKDLAVEEIEQINSQIAAAEFRVAIAEKELDNHLIQIENAKATDVFMRSKYTNEELYQWQVGQISGVYFQSYKLAYDLAKRAERCFRFELGLQDSSYINFGYWDSLKKGLLSGEKLQYDLRRLETAYLDQNRREFELTKHISLVLLDPLALIKLRETGRCFFQFPEEIFDLDYPGHFFRRIKSVSLTLPCITGPYTTISCTLRLLKSEIRITTDIQNGYPHNSEGDLPADDPRFIENNIPVKAIAASSAQNDSGLFELNFRDDRYLPFEGAGAISGWSLELFTDLPSNNPDPSKPDFGSPLRQFDYATISDAIVHIRYTAREDAGPFKNLAIENLRTHFSQDATTPSLLLLDLRREFPSQWHRFVAPTNSVGANIFEFEMSPSLFQIKEMNKTVKINTIWLLARCADPGVYKVVLTPPLAAVPVGSNTFSLAKVDQYGGLHFSQKDVALNVVPTNPPVQWQLQITGPLGGNLQVKEVEDLILVLGYQLDLQ